MPLFDWRTRYWSFLLKLAKSRPSWTIQAQPGPAIGPFHWDNRRLSVAEMAALQTFPKGYKFVGGRVSVQRQLGNAVPSLLAEVLAREIARQFWAVRNSHQLALRVRPKRPIPPTEPVGSVPKEFHHLTGELCLLFIHPPAHGSEVSPAARNTLDSARIPRASKLLICGLFQEGRVLAQDGDAPRPRRRKPGRQRKYSNHAIETAVTLGMVFHLSSRQSEGLLRSLFALMKLDNDVPDHTTISRRKAKLGKVPFYQDKQKTPLHILIDSSGLAVHAGQLRRAPKSRDYRKLHLCVDEQTGEVVAGELTSKRARDSSRVASLVGQIDSPISSARADTAYDASGVYEAIENHSAHRSPRVLIPPRKGAQLASGPASSRQRNRNIAAQARLGKRKWHTESGYSKRSKVETTFHRYKAIVGSAMRARGLAAQRVEARIGCKILNTMTALGMPDSEMIG